MKVTALRILALGALLTSGHVLAQASPTPLPAWDKVNEMKTPIM